MSYQYSTLNPYLGHPRVCSSFYWFIDSRRFFSVPKMTGVNNDGGLSAVVIFRQKKYGLKPILTLRNRPLNL